MSHVSKRLMRLSAVTTAIMVVFFFTLCAQTIYWTAQPETASLAIADDGDDLLLSIVPVLAAVAAKSRLEMDITAPVNGDKLKAGEWYWIIWRGSSAVSNFDIELSTDAGATYPIKIVSSTPNDGSYVWGPVPFHDPAKLSSSCKIRIKDSANPKAVLGQSDGLFTLQSTGEPVLLQELCDDNDALSNDPLQKDTDDDGLYDNLEIYLGTDPLNWDSDRDGYNDFREVFPDDVLDKPIPDGDGDGKIAAVDNDDDNDGLNDGRILDSDGDTIPNYLETYGFVYDSTSTLAFYPWDGDIEKHYYKTNPRQSSTDQDQYSDLTEITGTNMDLTVQSPGDKPMIAALPIFVARLKNYTVTPINQITETNGTVHDNKTNWSQSLELSNSHTEEVHADISTEVNASYSFTSGFEVGGSVTSTVGGSLSKTISSSSARSIGGEMSDATQWSQASCADTSNAANLELTFTVQNIGTCSAGDVKVSLNVKLADVEIATLSDVPSGGIQLLTAGQVTPDTTTIVTDKIPLNINQLRALRCGAPITTEIIGISGDVRYKDGSIYYSAGSWNNYFNAANATAAHLFLDLGDGNTTEHLVYAGTEPWEPVVTLKDALIWAANGQETAQGPMVQFYQPGGSLGDLKPLEHWYFSLDQGTYDELSSYLEKNPDFNLFDTVLKPGSVVVAKAPPINPTPEIHWALLSPFDKTVTAYVDDYFYGQDKIDVCFIDKYGVEHPMVWDPVNLHYVCDSLTNQDGSVYTKNETEKIIAKNPMYDNRDDPLYLEYLTEMPFSEMAYDMMKFVYIEPGTFWMGSPPDEWGPYVEETQHQVQLTQGFYMQTTEVTQGQWQAVMGSNPSYHSGCGDNCPVEKVSWNDVQDFIDALRDMGEGTYRLPTEAEWEYACRAGSTSAFANGEITVTNCSYDPNLDAMGWYCYNAGDTTHPVAQKQANAWGLYDMHGNVYEWCQDWYDEYPDYAVQDPQGPASGTHRVMRGGGWIYEAWHCRSANRQISSPGIQNAVLGFRLVRVPAQ